MPNPNFEKQVRLLLRVIPEFSGIEALALKGGTAINLFIQELPRLSVDLDFSYTGLEQRPEALARIDAELHAVARRLSDQGLQVRGQVMNGTATWVKLSVSDRGVQVKAEVNPVIRGLVYLPEKRSVTASTEEQFGFAETWVASMPDVYAGKIVAALDRQHPRDLFDVKLMLEQDLLDRQVFTAFLVYLISHDRRISEILDPKLKPIENEYQTAFVGMTAQNVSLSELEDARTKLLARLKLLFTVDDKAFLMGFKERNPDWSLLGIPHVKDLPAVRWKMKNLLDMPTGSWTDAVSKLRDVLDSL
jgi:predicted nucleotidyltransferase component of viral defense system